MKILLVLTSHDQLGNTGKKTGFWFEELAAPYYTFKDADAEVVLASPKGGRPPLDPTSNTPKFQTKFTHRFEADSDANTQLHNSVRLDSVSQEDFDSVFYVGGHGPMWDLTEDEASIKLIESFLASGKPVALTCHAPAALRHVKRPDGKPVVEGKKVTGFANSEEEFMGMTAVVPFLLETILTREGAKYSKAGDFKSHVVNDGLLLTGQNPASSGPLAEFLLKQLAKSGS